MKAALLLFLAFTSTNADGNYSDTLARDRMLPAAAAAYMLHPQYCVQNRFNGGNLKRKIDVKCDKLFIDTCSGFSAYATGDKAILLAFRGTMVGTQMIIESEQTVFAKHTPWAAGGAVSKYFNDAFFDIWNKGMKDDFLTLVNQYPGYQLWITGHSLGAALAGLCASHISYNGLFPKNNITLYTFGEPRTGDANYAAAVDRDVPNAWRVVHSHDMIAHLPLKNMEGYKHHKSEAYYPAEDMGPGAKYILCRNDEDMNCSDGNKIDDDFNDHVIYFNTSLGAYGEQHCNYTLDGIPPTH